MAIPEIQELEDAARKIVHHAMRAGTASSLTPRIVRQELEKKFTLEEGSLDGNEYKAPIRAAIAQAVEEDPFVDSTTDDSPKSPSRLKKKRTSDEGPGTKAVSKASTSKGKAGKKDTKATSKPKQESKPTSKRKVQKKDTKDYKSAEHVPTSDVEMEDPKSEKEDEAEPEDKEDLASTPPPKKRRKVVVSDNEEDEEEESKPRSKSKPTSKTKSNDKDEVMKSASESELSDVPSKDKKGKQKSKAKVEEDTKSDSELSVLIDEPPKRKGKAKKEPTKTTKKTKAKGSASLSKEEETIKRLKSLVVACGVRKVWSKVFQGIDSPQQQIKELKEILADLGMTGRMSLEQAKSIREKRELAKELEDVQQFEKVVVGSSRRRSEAAGKDSGSGSEKGSESEEEEAVPRKRARNARQSIMAFLQDQSDESD